MLSETRDTSDEHITRRLPSEFYRFFNYHSNFFARCVVNRFIKTCRRRRTKVEEHYSEILLHYNV